MAFIGVSALAAPIGNCSLSKPSLGFSRRNGKLAYASRVGFAADRNLNNKSVAASCLNSSPKSATFYNIASFGMNQIMHTSSPKGLPLSLFSAVSSGLSIKNSGGLSGGVSMQCQGRKCLVHPRAHRYSPFGFRYPEITEKPVWWWRTLACIPYLIALQLSEVGHYLRPFSDHYEFFEHLVVYIPGAFNRWPRWFSRWYHFVMYLLVVKNKKVPHFFRFHLMMGILMEIALQLVVRVSNFMPLIHYRGTFKVGYWGVIAFIYMAILLECVRCALIGKYAEIPFLNESAYIHTLFGTDIKIGDIFK